MLDNLGKYKYWKVRRIKAYVHDKYSEKTTV